MLAGPLSFANSLTLCRTLSERGYQMAKRRFYNGRVLVMKMTFPIEGQEQVKMMPKSLTRMPRTITINLP